MSRRRTVQRVVAPAWLAGLAGLALTVGGCAAEDDPPATGDPSPGETVTSSEGDGTRSPSAADRGLWLRFDEGDGELDLSHSGPRRPDVRVSSAGAQVSVAPDRRDGHAARLPRPEEPPEGAAAIVVTGGWEGLLSPGREAFSFGAEVRLDEVPPDHPEHGSNLLQRGLFEGPQYKLQLDGGRPSCRVAGPAGEVFVEASETLEPARWYAVRCSRSGQEVTLEVTTDSDGEAQVSTWSGTGATGDLVFSGTPLSVGGKVDGEGEVIADDADQLHGLVDEVFVELGRPG